MRPTASQLAGRDPAKAALLGAFDGTDFGVERSPFGSDFGADMSGDYDEYDDDEDFDSFGDDYHGDPFGDDYHGESFGAEFGGRRRRRRHPRHGATVRTGVAPGGAPTAGQPAPPPPAARLNPMERRALWEYRQRRAHTRRHRRLINPNEGSDIKLERYSFSLFNMNNKDIVIGDIGTEINYSGQPDVRIRPERVLMNPPSPGFVTIQDIKVANISATVGGNSDAFEYSPLAVGTALNIPTISSSTRATVLGVYSGYTPPGFTAGNSYPFTVSFQGIAEMTA